MFKKFIKKILTDSLCVISLFLIGGIIICIMGYIFLIFSLQDNNLSFLNKGIIFETVGGIFILYFVYYLFSDKSEL